MHVGVHDAPDAMVLVSPHVAEFATVGSVHGFGLHDSSEPRSLRGSGHGYQ